MEFLIVVGVITLIFAALNHSEYIYLAKFLAAIAVLLLLAVSVWYLTTSTTIETKDVVRITNQDGIELVGYFEESTLFRIVPNHITEITVIHPRPYSMGVIKYEF
jgi:hypothetical protein